MTYTCCIRGFIESLWDMVMVLLHLLVDEYGLASDGIVVVVVVAVWQFVKFVRWENGKKIEDRG